VDEALRKAIKTGEGKKKGSNPVAGRNGSRIGVLLRDQGVMLEATTRIELV
jgi:hypothetical protein